MPKSPKKKISPGELPAKKGPARVRQPRFAIAIMAAGKGTRLKSKHPKVLHEVGGQPMLRHVIRAAQQVVAPKDIHVIIGHEAERVRDAVADLGVNFVLQAEQRGTGHAIMVARDALAHYDHVLVLSGDVPLITPRTIAAVRAFHLVKNAAMTVLTAEAEHPHGYGRVIRKRPNSDDVEAIVEEKALTPAQRRLNEINSGIYAFRVKPLLENLGKLTTDNAHHEYYLTDIAAMLVKQKRAVLAMLGDYAETIGSNTRAELAMIDMQMRALKCTGLMNAGVTILYPHTCIIDVDVEIAPDTVVEPFVQLRGKTKIGSECRIRSYSVITDSEIAEGVTIRPGCVIERSRIAAGAVIGPYSHLRPDTEIGEGAHVGNFVETKKARLGKGSKANHLTYLGDALIGDGVNVGAGTITCNYDGAEKHATVIDDGAFIGSDATLVAPVRVGAGAYVAAGSCITDNVPADSLALGRARQVVKEGWAREKRAARAASRSK